MTQAISRKFIDNDRTRVTEWRFAPGAETGQHRHEYDYVVVPMLTGQLRIVSSDGEVLSDLTVGSPYFRPAGVEHNVFSANDFEFVFVEIEFK
jgi:quercetin dioxygenase-like cupin family protein